ncbi:hypothetical protein ACQP2E_14010 [Actinoplanes sp. CA-015351]
MTNVQYTMPTATAMIAESIRLPDQTGPRCRVSRNNATVSSG